jgi:indole-3-glycerol phosphate synthase/phosphoribosylanthranilate isomerase
VNGEGVLGRIVMRRREQLLVTMRERPLEVLRREGRGAIPVRSLTIALTRPGRVNVIAEFKRRSPSRGLIREDLHPVGVAQSYEVAGAAALSVLTEEQFFGGTLGDLREAHAATLLPTLRKDFVVEPYQVWEAWQAGADAVLLIVAALPGRELGRLLQTADEAGIEALVEVHDEAELDRALRAGARLVGVNNRDLRTMKVDLGTSLALAERIPDEVVAVAESGLRTGADIRRLRDVGFDAFLVGEHLMLAADPGQALEELIREAGALPRAQPDRVAVKICGLTSVDDARAAVAAGADAIGLVFWPKSSRAVTVAQARSIASALPPFVTRVGVFVDASAEEMNGTAEAVGLDVLQLHGDEQPDLLPHLSRRSVKALRVGEGFDAHAVEPWRAASGVLLDVKVAGSPGGTGQSFEWELAVPARDRTPYLALAGGLHPANVGEAIRVLRPDAVDVSSGVESAPGRKDPAAMRAFVKAVREAEKAR